MNDKKFQNPLTRRNVVLGGAAGIAGAAVFAQSQKTEAAEPTTVAQNSSSGMLEGKVALVTGAARGIGRATAIELAQKGADIALLDIADPQGVSNIQGYRLATEAELDEAVSLIEAEGKKAVKIIADVRDLAAMKQAAQTITQQLGGLDILVANAGIAIWSPFAEMTSEQWQNVIDVNLTGVANSMWAVLPQMQQQQNGNMIIVSSIGGRQGVAGVTNYASTKWAVIGLAKSAALELGADNIRVNVVAPTAVDTPLYRSEGQYLSTGMNSFEEQDEAMLGYHSLPIPIVEPIDIARAIAFLASNEARYISGMVMDVAAGGNARYTA
ncbi:mycofactocin-coupled SDR family oxidoreductase [Pleurocapsales cyanobacterium LEGE 10410]|nr:mycofactocin-coupled SDR family oxidoreductase [Pleurocapsales cyanobacterium LEGE 10410]